MPTERITRRVRLLAGKRAGEELDADATDLLRPKFEIHGEPPAWIKVLLGEVTSPATGPSADRGPLYVKVGRRAWLCEIASSESSIRLVHPRRGRAALGLQRPNYDKGPAEIPFLLSEKAAPRDPGVPTDSTAAPVTLVAVPKTVIAGMLGLLAALLQHFSEDTSATSGTKGGAA